MGESAQYCERPYDNGTGRQVERCRDQKADDVYKEISANLMPNARLVPAGIVAVDRAQEHGYSIAYVG